MVNYTKHVDVTEFFKGDQLKIEIFKSKYLTSTDELVSECFYRIAKEIASVPIEDNKEYWTERWANEFLNDIWRPGGSIIAGVNKTNKKISLFNCFRRSTEFITSDGIASFYDFDDGDEVFVLNRYGKFVPATVKCFGKQKLVKLTLGKNGRYIDVFTTSDHEWDVLDKNLVRSIKKTNDLLINDVIPHIRKKHNPTFYHGNCIIGFIHGLIFGDGELSTNNNWCSITLCGDSVQFAPIIEKLGYNRYDLDIDKIKFTGFPNFMKSFPNFDEINDEYIISFFRGWFAADGHFSANSSCYISSSEKWKLEKFKSISETLGIYCSDVNLMRNESPFDGNPDQKLYRVNILRDSIFHGFLTKQNHIDEYNEYLKKSDVKRKTNWLVKSVESTDLIEDVWCVVEPETHTFVLAGGINTRNCTHLPLPADNLESIYKSRYEVAKAAAYRQGIGVDFSKLRPRGTSINNSAEESEGAVHWMKSFDKIGNEVGQKGRRPAILGSLKISHPDIEEFISSKDDMNGLQNMNISVQTTNDFMTCVENDLDWKMNFVVESTGEQISKTIKARSLFKKICDHAWKTGDPGLQFIDLMNQYSMQAALGYDILGTNACSEKPLPPYGVCALASINMEKVPHLNNMEAFELFMKEVTRSMVRFMDNVVEYELTHEYKSPLEKQYEIVKSLREIGLGVTNLHKWLFDQGFEYDSEEGISAIETFFKHYFFYAFLESCNLAESRGACPAWNKIVDTYGKFTAEGLQSKETKFLSNIFTQFPILRDKYYSGGIRNGALLSVAPTGTLSLTFGSDVLSSGIEPIIGIYYWRRTRAISKGEWDYFFVVPKAIKSIVLEKMEDKNSEDYKTISAFSGSVKDNDGTEGDRIVKIIHKYLDVRLLKNTFQIDPFKKIEMIGRIQQYVDAAISVTFNVRNEFSESDIYNLFLETYRKKIKAITVFRDGSRDGIMFFTFPKNKTIKQEIDPTKRPKDINYALAPERPKKIPCEVHRIMGHKVIVGLLNSKPYEVFIIDYPKTLPEDGFIIKSGKRKYKLLDLKDSTLVDNIIDNEVANEQIQAVTRLISSNLRHGVPIDFVCEQLGKCGDSISSYPKMLGRALKKYKFLDDFARNGTTEKCPVCGEPLQKHDGCLSCVSCMFSKCS